MTQTTKSDVIAADYVDLKSQKSKGSDVIHVTGGEGEEKVTPLPKLELWVICLMLLSDGFAMTMLFPFVVWMVIDLGVADNERDAGLYAGILASAFSFAQFCSSFFWGRLSDRIGRRPVLLTGLLGSTVCVVVFGFSTTYTMAIIARLIHGLLNGNGGVGKAYIGEITDKTNQAAGMSMVGTVIGVSVIMGPAVGGFFSQPSEKYPELFPPGSLFDVFPYALPCIVSAIISLFGLLLGWFYLPIIPRKPLSTTCSSSASSSASSSGDVEMRLFDSRTPNSPLVDDLGREYEATKQGGDLPSTPSSFSHPSLSSPTPSPQSFMSLMREHDIRVCVFLYSGVILLATVNGEAISFWAITSPEMGGGLNFTSTQVGLYLGTMGISMLVFQLKIFSKIARYFGMVSAFRWAMLLISPTITFNPTLSFFVYHPHGTIFIWTFLLIAGTIRACAFATGLISIFTILNNSVTRDRLGAVNGLGESAAALVKAVGPALAGAAYSWSLENGLSFPFNYYFLFLILGLLSLICFLVARFDLDESLNHPKHVPGMEEKEEKDDVAEAVVMEAG